MKSLKVNNPIFILTVIVLSQFCCTSLWFASNAVLGDLILNFNLDRNALGHLTSSVQFGFIFGTLVFAVLTIADRFSAPKVFFINAILGAIFNVAIIWGSNTFISILILRFFTGFFLAGIYPVGMKIASDHFDKGLGKALGFLVGALVLGTAFPHFLNGFSQNIPWESVIITTSLLATFGGTIMIIFIPSIRKNSIQKLKLSAFIHVFENRKFRSAAFGYFGHMWELYAFWAFIPLILNTYKNFHPAVSFNIAFLSFSVIAIGSLGCIAGGYISLRLGVKRTAFLALLLSGICCLCLPFIIQFQSMPIFIGFLIFWGIMVVADSPLFSTLVAQNAASEIKGTALTIVNCIGFSITIISIQLLSFLQFQFNSTYIYMILAIGPVLGLIALKRKGALSD